MSPIFWDREFDSEGKFYLQFSLVHLKTPQRMNCLYDSPGYSHLRAWLRTCMASENLWHFDCLYPDYSISPPVRNKLINHHFSVLS